MDRIASGSELPSSVRLSHLVAAHYPELRTLGADRFAFLANRTVLPETVLGEATTPFQKDVFLLGVASHEILLGKPPLSAGDGNPPEWDLDADEAGTFPELHEWLGRALSVELDQRFPDAQVMLDAYNEAANEGQHSIAYERLSRHAVWGSSFALFREFPPTEFLREDSRVVVYRSTRHDGSYLVKSWTASHLGDPRVEAGRLLSFLERANDLAGGACRASADRCEQGSRATAWP